MPKDGLGLFFLDSYLVLSAIARHEDGCSGADVGRWLDNLHESAVITKASLYSTCDRLEGAGMVSKGFGRTATGHQCYLYKVTEVGSELLDDAAVFLKLLV